MPPRLSAYARRLQDFVWAHWFVLACVAAAALRLISLGPEIDGPHEWRQCDTASFTRNFFRDGIDLFHPSVNWLGTHKTVILEFALPEALVASIYKLFWPSLVFDRLFYLAFFAGSAFYLYRIVRLFHERFVAQLCVVIYCFLPLSLFYSRAIHIDFFVIFFAHAFLYHAAFGYRERRALHLLLALVAGIIAFLVKAPYVFYLALPLAVVVLCRFNLRWAASLAAVVAASVLVFGVWRHYVDGINGQIPDLSFLASWHPYIDRGWWYYGPFELRLNPVKWASLFGYRPLMLTLGVAGIALVLFGLYATLRDTRYSREAKLFFLAWTTGFFLYTAVFFNLNVVMDYYQMPAVAIWSYYGAVGLDTLYMRSRAAMVAAAALAVVSFVHIGETKYFENRTALVEAGDVIRAATPANALVMAVSPEAETADYPCALYFSDRFGWALGPQDLTVEAVARLKTMGATHVAIQSTSRQDGSIHDCAFCGQRIVAPTEVKDHRRVSVYELAH
jgi:4-amino-4-deoxy-L-arabinose transferase-like glycosyltransferase